MMTRYLAVALAGLLAAATPALAQDSQYWNIQYGPVGQLLGGQVVGSTRDLSATYYNPGGLALGRNPEFLLSVQAFKAESLSIKPVEGGQVLDDSHTEFDTFPGFFAFAFPESWLGENTRLAFSVLTRQQYNGRLDQRFAGVAPVGRYGLETLFDQRMSETWGGLTVSHRLSDRFGLGATVFGVYRGQRTRVEQSVQIVEPQGAGISALVIDDFDFSHWRALAKVGLAWEGDSVRLGMAVTTPSAGLFGSGNVGFTRSATGPDLDGDGRPDAYLLNGLDQNVDSTYESSWALAAGGAWRRGSLQLHASAEYFAPVDSFAILQGRASTGDPAALVQQFDGVINAGIGAEYWLGGVSANQGAHSGGTVLYGAFATDFTASPEVLVNEASTSNMDLYNITAGTAFSVGRSRFSVGVSRSSGRKTRDFGVGGLPPSIPIIGAGHPVDVRYSRWVFVLGYLFGSKD